MITRLILVATFAFASLISATALTGAAFGQTPPAASAPSVGSAKEGVPAAPKPKQFVYVLRLVPRLHDDKAWTDVDKSAVGRHFAHLQAATKEGRIILAGRTLEPGEKTFGLVIFEAADGTDARAFMNSDPSVIEKVMTAELHPYQVALQRK